MSLKILWERMEKAPINTQVAFLKDYVRLSNEKPQHYFVLYVMSFGLSYLLAVTGHFLLLLFVVLFSLVHLLYAFGKYIKLYNDLIKKWALVARPSKAFNTPAGEIPAKRPKRT